MRSLLLAAALLIAAASAFAEDAEDCTARWLQAEEKGILLGVAMMDGTPTFGVDRKVWDSVDYATRAGMMETFICVMTDPGEMLARAQIIDGKGRKLATWDGGKFEILQ